MERVRDHGKCGTELYNLWAGMKARCYCEGADNYKFYGARGIGICNEWRRDFLAFERWALANGYAPELTIDRIDNDNDYSPENCRFVPLAINVQNSRTAKLTKPQVDLMRKLWASGKWKTKELAKYFSISLSNVGSIVNHQTWK